MQTDESFDCILSLDDTSRGKSFTPTKKMDIDCLRKLYDIKAIIIDPNSKVDAFVESEDGDFDSLYINKTQWIPNVSWDDNERLELNEIYNKLYDELKSGVRSSWESEVNKFLFTVAREEV